MYTMQAQVFQTRQCPICSKAIVAGEDLAWGQGAEAPYLHVVHVPLAHARNLSF